MSIMLSLANHIVGVANDRKLGVTHLHLQKTLYFMLLEAINKNRINEEKLEEIYDEAFEVWPYGPVVRSVYENYIMFNSSNITIEATPMDEYNYLNDIIIELLNESTSKLVQDSHNHPFWIENYNAGNIEKFNNPEYTIEDLKVAAKYESDNT